jgi:hypothetical protein
MRSRIVLLTMRALLIPIGLSIVVGIAASVACSSSVAITTVPTFGTCSDATGYAIVTADDCPGLSCGTYYATCDGTAFNGCDCDIPSGYTEVSFSGGDGGTGSETGTGDDGGAETGTGGDAAAETGTGDDGGAETGTGDDTGTGSETGSGGDDSGSATD